MRALQGVGSDSRRGIIDPLKGSEELLPTLGRDPISGLMTFQSAASQPMRTTFLWLFMVILCLWSIWSELLYLAAIAIMTYVGPPGDSAASEASLMKPTVYLDATIPSFYFEVRPGAIMQAWHEITVEFGEATGATTCSSATKPFVELQETGYPEDKRRNCLKLVAGLSRLAVTPEVTELVAYYLGNASCRRMTWAMRSSGSGDLVSHAIPPHVELQAPGEREQVRAHSNRQHPQAVGFTGAHHTSTVTGNRTMKNVPLIDELRAIRQRLAEEQELDVDRYAAMLQQVAQTLPGDYLREPFLPPAAYCEEAPARDAS